MVISVCQWLGVAIEMASMYLSSSSLRNLCTSAAWVCRASSSCSRPLAMCASSTSQIATSSHVGRACCSPPRWSLPRPPMPMHATRTVSFGLPNTALDAAPRAAAELIKKFLRSMEAAPVLVTVQSLIRVLTLPHFADCPPRNAATFATARSIRRERASRVAQAMCGVTRQLRAVSSGLSSAGRLHARAHPARPPRGARRSAHRPDPGRPPADRATC